MEAYKGLGNDAMNHIIKKHLMMAQLGKGLCFQSADNSVLVVGSDAFFVPNGSAKVKLDDCLSTVRVMYAAAEATHIFIIVRYEEHVSLIYFKSDIFTSIDNSMMKFNKKYRAKIIVALGELFKVKWDMIGAKNNKSKIYAT